MNLEAIIGLEVHVQLKTASKMFCRCDNRDDQSPNSAICPICSGQPGTLPLPNRQAIDWAIMASLALGCSINQESKFDRKHYFYPDLPKGYQISQYDKPFGVNGQVKISVGGEVKTFRVHRLHLEEDAGKLIHSGKDTLVDLNRAGTPLMEIVSEPDFRSPAEAKAYMQELRLIMRYLGVSDADMEKGHLRCDANISLRPVGDEQLYPKTEVKNINSFKAVERALAYEIERQTALWEDGQQPTVGATRGWDEATQKTVEQRTKEEAADYRYFPEPDIPPIVISDDHLVELKAAIPELPEERLKRFQQQYLLQFKEALSLISEKDISERYEESVSEFREYSDAKNWETFKEKASKQIANFIINRISGEYYSQWGFGVSTKDFGRLMWMLFAGEINMSVATTLFEQMRLTKKGPHLLVKELGLAQKNDKKILETTVQKIVAANPNVVQDIKSGKTAAKQRLIGLAMKDTQGTANVQMLNELFDKELGL